MEFYPTFSELVDPSTLPAGLRDKARAARTNDPLASANLLNMSWHNGGEQSFFVFPKAITGLECEILILSGRHFPSGSHKVGPVYSALREAEISGRIDRATQTAVFPSTGNYGIGGAWVSGRMGYKSLVILPEEMSRERFEMIEAFGSRVKKTPGCESNVKEIFDEVNRISQDPNYAVLNQFSDFANYRFHYHVTGRSIAKIAREQLGKRLAGVVSAMGSAGTLAAGDFLKAQDSNCVAVGLEPVQCPTLFNVGVGPHRIEGIGDKHVTWIHNVHNTDWLFCIDDSECLAVLQLLHQGTDLLAELTGVDRYEAASLVGLFGVSGVCNLLGAVRTAHQLKLGEGDVLATFATDSFDRYPSVMQKWTADVGALDSAKAEKALIALRRPEAEYALEGTDRVQARWHNQKYFTWVEQQGKSILEWEALAKPKFWADEAALAAKYDESVLNRRQ